MPKRLLTLSTLIIALSLASFAAPKKTGASVPGPDRAHLQKILDGWSSMDAATVASYYLPGDHLFFDIAPAKYSNWGEYQAGATQLLKGYKSIKLTINDDIQIHHEAGLTWAAATLKEEAVTTTGKHEMGTLRWTVVLQNEGGKWLIVHEHVSQPAAQ